MNFKMFMEHGSLPNDSELKTIVRNMNKEYWENAPIFADWLEDRDYNDTSTLQFLRSGAPVGSVAWYHVTTAFSGGGSSGPGPASSLSSTRTFGDALSTIKHSMYGQVALGGDRRSIKWMGVYAKLLRTGMNSGGELNSIPNFTDANAYALSPGVHELAVFALNLR